MSTVVEEREPLQRIPSGQLIELGVEKEMCIEPIKDDVKQATNRNVSSPRDHKAAAVVRQVPNPHAQWTLEQFQPGHKR